MERYQELQKIRHFHIKNKPVVITGKPGVGKTELALKYASIHKELFKSEVLLIDLQTSGLMLNEVIRLAKDLDLLFKLNSSYNIVENIIVEFINRDILLIVDNAINDHSFITNISAISSKHSNINILITSRQIHWDHKVFGVVKINSFSKREAIAFLKVRLPSFDSNLEEDMHLKFPSALEYVPLVMEKVADTIGCQVDKYSSNEKKIDYILTTLRHSDYLRYDADLEDVLWRFIYKEKIHKCVKSSIVNSSSSVWTDAQFQKLVWYYKTKTILD